MVFSWYRVSMPTHTQDEIAQTNVRRDPQVRAALEQIAKDDRRSMSAQVAWLIEQEAERRGIKLEPASN